MSAPKRRKKKNPREGYVLIPTANGLEWQKPETEKSATDEVFDRVLARFGWARDSSGNLEHTGSSSVENHF
jgi:hypothetical protein